MSLNHQSDLNMASVTNSSATKPDPTSRDVGEAAKHNGKKRPTNEVVTTPLNHGPGTTSRKRRNSINYALQASEDDPVAEKNKKDLDMQPSGPIITFDGLCWPGKGTRSRVNETPQQVEQRLARMCGAVRTLLECVGEDPDREGLRATPMRYAKALLFLTQGYQVNVEKLVNNALFHEGHNEMVIVRNIEINSLCEHHLVPFTGKIHIGYIPSGTVIGLSKLARIAEVFSRRLQVQERLTKEVAETIMGILKPHGVAVVMESSHLCMVMRGVEKSSSTTVTSCFRGCFEAKSKRRSEFVSLVGSKGS